MMNERVDRAGRRRQGIHGIYVIVQQWDPLSPKFIQFYGYKWVEIIQIHNFYGYKMNK